MWGDTIEVLHMDFPISLLKRIRLDFENYLGENFKGNCVSEFTQRVIEGPDLKIKDVCETGIDFYAISGDHFDFFSISFFYFSG